MLIYGSPKASAHQRQIGDEIHRATSLQDFSDRVAYTVNLRFGQLKPRWHIKTAAGQSLRHRIMLADEVPFFPKYRLLMHAKKKRPGIDAMRLKAFCEFNRVEWALVFKNQTIHPINIFGPISLNR